MLRAAGEATATEAKKARSILLDFIVSCLREGGLNELWCSGEYTVRIASGWSGLSEEKLERARAAVYK